MILGGSRGPQVGPKKFHNILESCKISWENKNENFRELRRYRFFLLVPPNFSTKKKIANQPITAAVPLNPVAKKARYWMLGSFLFGSEIEGY